MAALLFVTWHLVRITQCSYRLNHKNDRILHTATCCYMLTNTRLSFKSKKTKKNNLIFSADDLYAQCETCSMWNHWDFTQEKHFLKLKYCLHFGVHNTKEATTKKLNETMLQNFAFLLFQKHLSGRHSNCVAIYFTVNWSWRKCAVSLLTYFRLLSLPNSSTAIAFVLSSNSMNYMHDIIATLHKHWSFRMFIKSFAQHIQLFDKKNISNICMSKADLLWLAN